MKFKYLNISAQIKLRARSRTNIRENKDPVALRLYDLESIFLLWSLGIIISCAIFGLEKYKIIEYFCFIF